MVSLHGVKHGKLNYLDKIPILQKRVIRMIFFADRYDHAVPLFINAHILPITFLQYESVASLMNDIDKGNALLSLLNLFEKYSTAHSYNTRSFTSVNFYVKSSRLKIQNTLFLDLE